MSSRYTIGLDFGTNSVRALIVDVADGREAGVAVANYPRGQAGIFLDPDQPDLARQHPLDYLEGIEVSVKEALRQASGVAGFSPSQVVGIGVDTTGSTPLPVDAKGEALGLTAAFKDDVDAYAWLWKDHTSHAEAEEITALAAKMRSNYLAKCGGRYSSEWFWAKILRCARVAPKVFDAAYTWVEIADWIPAVLSGTTDPKALKRGICAAGHKAFYHADWGGYADVDFVTKLDPRLARVQQSLPATLGNVAEEAGKLSSAWAQKLGLPQGIPVAIGAFDAHLGAVGAGIAEGTLVKIMGTSTCDIMSAPLSRKLADIPGLCGIVPESVIPGSYGLEAGQSAVGDIFNWLVLEVLGGKSGPHTHESLTKDALKIGPGESGLLSLDWHNGNRTVLVDQRLTGLIVGLNLQSSPAEIYRAMIEATAYGARVIMERFEAYGVPVTKVVNCGGIAARSPLAMQIYADVMNRPLTISKSTQTCALGSAIAAAVVAGAYDSFEAAIPKMAGGYSAIYQPNPESVAIYEKLYQLYLQLHDAFGISGTKRDLSHVMKDLLDLRDSVRGK